MPCGHHLEKRVKEKSKEVTKVYSVHCGTRKSLYYSSEALRSFKMHDTFSLSTHFFEHWHSRGLKTKAYLGYWFSERKSLVLSE